LEFYGRNYRLISIDHDPNIKTGKINSESAFSELRAWQFDTSEKEQINLFAYTKLF